MIRSIFCAGRTRRRAIEARTSPNGAGHYMEYHRPVVAALYFLKAAELGAVVPYAHATDLGAGAGRHGGAVDAAAQRRASVGLAAVAAAAVLCVLGGVRIGADFHSGVVSALLVQHALWDGDAASIRAVRGGGAGRTGGVAAAVGEMDGAGDDGADPGEQQFCCCGRGRWSSRRRSRIRAHALRLRPRSANWLRILPPGKTLLMYTSEHIGAVQQAGMPLRDIINEGDYYEWNAALKDPAAKADYVVALDGDTVAKAVAAHPQGLTLEQIICSTGQPCARIYPHQPE